MRFTAAVLIIILLNFLLGLFLPWWVIAIVGFGSGFLIDQTPVKSFLSGLLSCFILWWVMALLVDLANNSVLSTKVAALFGLPQSWMLVLLTGLIGGLVTGMGALTGALLKKLIVARRAA